MTNLTSSSVTIVAGTTVVAMTLQSLEANQHTKAASSID